MSRKAEDHPEIPFAEYRAREGNLTFWAKQMPEAFSIELKKGLIDQRKVGAKNRIQYVQRLKGKAGDYLVITDEVTGARNVFPREVFEKHFVLMQAQAEVEDS